GLMGRLRLSGASLASVLGTTAIATGVVVGATALSTEGALAACDPNGLTYECYGVQVLGGTDLTDTVTFGPVNDTVNGSNPRVYIQYDYSLGGTGFGIEGDGTWNVNNTNGNAISVTTSYYYPSVYDAPPNDDDLI